MNEEDVLDLLQRIESKDHFNITDPLFDRCNSSYDITSQKTTIEAACTPTDKVLRRALGLKARGFDIEVRCTTDRYGTRSWASDWQNSCIARKRMDLIITIDQQAQVEQPAWSTNFLYEDMLARQSMTHQLIHSEPILCLT